MRKEGGGPFLNLPAPLNARDRDRLFTTILACAEVGSDMGGNGSGKGSSGHKCGSGKEHMQQAKDGK